MTLPLHKNHSEKISIDVFFSLIDNYGDIGFATELLISFERAFPNMYHFRIFVDRRDIIEPFIDRNKESMPSYETYELPLFHEVHFSPIIFLLFHFPIPDISSTEKYTILRIDYLSFDPDWVKNHGHEHIKSTEQIQIIEIIPSLLPHSGGVLLPFPLEPFSRKEFLQMYHLPNVLEHKKWITCFVYDETRKRIDFTSLGDDIIVFLLGADGQANSHNIYTLPFLSIRNYHALLGISDMNIIRGEVSAVAAFQSGKPFLWDMYKGRGGFPIEMSEQFLEFSSFGTDYSLLHRSFNSGDTSLDLARLQTTLENESRFFEDFPYTQPQHLLSTLKKYIDRFYFSL